MKLSNRKDRSFEEYVNLAIEGKVRLRNEWTKARGLSIYCRKSIRYPGIIILANIQATVERKGHLTRFLDIWEDKVPLEVEHPHNPFLKDFLLRRGWQIENVWGDVCVYNHLAYEIVKERKEQHALKLEAYIAQIAEANPDPKREN